MPGRWGRLRGHGPFQRVFRQGRSTTNETIALFVLEDASSPSRVCRVTAAAGKRLGKAHVRNRAKRLLREAWRLGAPPLSGRDVILLARPGILGSDLGRVLQALKDVVEKAGLNEDRRMGP